MDALSVSPMDAHNRVLVDNAHPPQWVNPTPSDRYHLVVIGGGTAGLVTAAGAAGLGARVALIERHLLGGDCLNVGCVPSKALIRSSRVLAELRNSARFGVKISGAEVDFAAVMERLRRLRAQISHHDSAQRFQSLGVDVFFGTARFLDSQTVAVADKQLRFRRAVIATGTRAAVPPVEGLESIRYLTNETVFNLTQLPRRLAIIGGGPIGCELAQAFRRLGSEVCLLHNKGHLLDKEDAEVAEIVENAFTREGVELILNSRIQRIENRDDGKAIDFHSERGNRGIVTDEILMATGRTPNLSELNLESVGVDYDLRQGIHVNEFLQTTNRRIYAAGDICSPWRFTHAADAAARIVIQNALFLGRKRTAALTVPRCTYTDPEVAHVGLSEREATARGIEFDTFTRELGRVDRAILEGETEGFVKVRVRKGTDRIVGATIVATHAGEMINEITLAMTAGLGLATVARVIHPYPTQAEAIRHTADAYNRTRLTPLARTLIGFWLKVNR